MGTEKRCCGQPRTKERESMRDPSHRPCPTFPYSSPSLSLPFLVFWERSVKKRKKKKKIVCQQSSGYTVHPVLFLPNSKLPLWNADSRGGAEIHFTLQGKIHSAWIHKQVRMQIVHTSTIKILFLGGKNSFTWQRMPDDFCHLTGEWVVSTAYL